MSILKLGNFVYHFAEILKYDSNTNPSILSVSLARARSSTDHSFFFLSSDFDEIYLCILNFPLLLSNS